MTDNSRRAFLAISAGAVAACAGLVVIALPAMADADPIFAAIDAHREAVTTFNAMHAKMVAEALNDSNGAPLPLQLAPAMLQAAFSAQLASAGALIDTAPTTRAGLRALEVYLRDERTRSVRTHRAATHIQRRYRRQL
jgi:hypothetical protein